MFRLCLDLATRPLLPQEHVPGLKRRTRRDLAPRLEWLFETNRLPTALRELSSCVREDGMTVLTRARRKRLMLKICWSSRPGCSNGCSQNRKSYGWRPSAEPSAVVSHQPVDEIVGLL
jgi:hypothetical protein